MVIFISLSIKNTLLVQIWSEKWSSFFKVKLGTYTNLNIGNLIAIDILVFILGQYHCNFCPDETVDFVNFHSTVD